MLLKGSLGSLLQQSVHALVQIVACHVVVDNSKAINVDGALVVAQVHVVRLVQVTLLLLELYVLFPRPAL